MSDTIDQTKVISQGLWILCLICFIFSFINAVRIDNVYSPATGENIRGLAFSFLLAMMGTTFGISGVIVYSKNSTTL